MQIFIVTEVVKYNENNPGVWAYSDRALAEAQYIALEEENKGNDEVFVGLEEVTLNQN